MSEMARGMYVVLEQFFRAPYTIMYPFEKVRIWESCCCLCVWREGVGGGGFIHLYIYTFIVGPDFTALSRRACVETISVW